MCMIWLYHVLDITYMFSCFYSYSTYTAYLRDNQSEGEHKITEVNLEKWNKLQSSVRATMMIKNYSVKRKEGKILLAKLEDSLYIWL
jgi:Tfp pilus assembly protein PilX